MPMLTLVPAPAFTPLIERSVWWVIPAVGLALFMVEAMMQFTSSLLERRPGGRIPPVPASELRARLLAINKPGLDFDLVEEPGGRLQLRWQLFEDGWNERFARVKLSADYRATMLLDETPHELRWYESIRTSTIFWGFDGWKPRLNFSLSYAGGYVNTIWAGVAFGILPGFPPRIGERRSFQIDTMVPKGAIEAVTVDSGWAFRPVTLPFYTSPRWLRLVRWLIPARVRRLPRRRLWRILYPVSYVAAVAYLMAFAGAWDRRSLLLLVLISVAWWGVWGGITWLLTRPVSPSSPRGRSR